MIEVPGYKIQHALGKGGMATVYLAVQESLNRPVALKILNKFDTEAQTARFFNEGKIIASLNHHNIITIHDLGEVNGRCFLAMEYLEGGDLNRFIRKGLQAKGCIQLLKLIANCLAFVHKKGIVHRDIKPENILFRKNGTPVLTDFGVAKQIQTDTSLTMDGMTVGSPYYMSPEQAEHKPLDAKTDIYSLGIVFYEMLTGQKPFQGSSPINIIIAHLTTEAAPLPKHLERYQELLNLMIAKDAADRFKSAADLMAFLKKLPKPASPHAVTKNLGRVISDKAKSIKRSIAIPLPIKKCVAAIKSQSRWIWPSIAFATIASVTIYFFTAQTKQTPMQPVAINEGISENETKIDVDVTATKEQERARKSITKSDGLNDETIQQLLTQAQYILDDQNLTLAKLRQAYDIYYLALNKDPDNVDALQGLDHITALDLRIQNEIDANLDAANKALKNFRLAIPEKDNALFYFQQALVLDPSNKVAQQGKLKVVNVYADLVERYQKAHDYSKAKIYLTKGLSIHPESTRLLALEDLNSKTWTQISTYLKAADKALKDSRLTIPQKNNALYYYQQVLRLDVNNRHAKQGQLSIANAYADLVERYQKAHDYSKAKMNLTRGLSIHPESTRLLALQDLNSKTWNQISANLNAADKALKDSRLAKPQKNSALYYYQQVLWLDVNNTQAKQGQLKVANAYADLAEIDLDTFDYNKAKANTDKGLAIDPNSERLLALKGKTNMFIDAPKRAFKKFISLFD